MHLITYLASILGSKITIFLKLWMHIIKCLTMTQHFLIKSFNWHCDYMILFSSSWLNTPNSEILLLALERVKGWESMSTCVSLLPHSLLPPSLALQCQDLPTSTKARVNCSHPFGDFRYQSTCSFTCDEGSFLVGASVLQCLDTGNWDAPFPECQGRMNSFQCLGNKL